jgi:hypothetical protein
MVLMQARYFVKELMPFGWQYELTCSVCKTLFNHAMYGTSEEFCQVVLDILFGCILALFSSSFYLFIFGQFTSMLITCVAEFSCWTTVKCESLIRHKTSSTTLPLSSMT